MLLATSTWHGPGSDGRIGVRLLGDKPPGLKLETPGLFALRMGDLSCGTEFDCFEAIQGMTAEKAPLLPELMRPPAPAPPPGAGEAAEREAALRALMRAYGLNEHQGAVLEHCSRWFAPHAAEAPGQQGGGAGAGGEGGKAAEKKAAGAKRKRGKAAEAAAEPGGGGAGAAAAQQQPPRKRGGLSRLYDTSSDEEGGDAPAGEPRSSGAAAGSDLEDYGLGSSSSEEEEDDEDGGGGAGGAAQQQQPPPDPPPRRLPYAPSNPICLVHGPFGTGKTHTIGALVRMIVRELELRGQPGRVLVASYTNTAVDRVLCALLDSGYEDFLRVGSARRMDTRVLPYHVSTSAKAADEEHELKQLARAD